MRGVRLVVATMISMPLLAGGARAAAIGPLDTTPPETTIDGGPSEFIPFTQATPTFTFQSSEDGSTFVCSLDGAPFAACDSPFTTPALTDSRHSLAVRAIDPAGNADPTPAVRDFTIDATAPDATLTTKPNRTVITPHRRATVEFRFLSSEAGSYFQCGFDGVALIRCSSPYWASVGPGEHRFEVRAFDRAGNGDPTPVDFRFVVRHKRGG